MNNVLAKSRGALVAKALAGCWRASPPPLELTLQELDQTAPLLLGSGAAGLGYWRVRHSEPHKRTRAAIALQHAYRVLALQETLREREIKRVFNGLRAAGVEPLLVKGWAAARLYPKTFLRPYGDIDICVEAGQHVLATDVLKSWGVGSPQVDLHAGFTELADRGTDELYARSRLVQMGDVMVRVLGQEDHVGLLAIHLFKHGAWRPLWLCDIGAAVESLPEDFNWGLCLGRDKQRAHWISCAIALAQQLLDARPDNSDVRERAGRPPAWLTRGVIKAWASPFATVQISNQQSIKNTSLTRGSLPAPGGLLRGLRHRWPNPIFATASLGRPVNNLPRLPYQVVNCAQRVAGFATRLPGLLRARRKETPG